MANATKPVQYVQLDDLLKRSKETYPYEVKDVGTFELRRITHGEVREITAAWVGEDGVIKDFAAFLDEMVLRACVTPTFTPETLTAYADDARVIPTLGQHIAYSCGILAKPAEQDRPKAPAAAEQPGSASS